ncbi:MAG: 6-phosphogluconolactonase [Janthinobacterium lividum]
MTDFEVLPTDTALADRAAALITDAAREAIAARGRFTIALTGGSSPHKTYELLAKASGAEQIDWSKVFVFVGDERFVPYEDERSNYGMCQRLLLNHVSIPKEQIFPIPTDTATPEDGSAEYAETLSSVFGMPQSGPPPALDVILLGMGDDGHCASLFPGMPSLTVDDAWVVSTPPGTLPPPVDRITVTFPVLNAARQVLFLVEGAKKAPAVRDILEGGATVNVHPSAGVQPSHGKLLWLLDKTAAGLLKSQA